MILMNKNIEVLFFDEIDRTIIVLNDVMLPYQLKDNIKNSETIKTIHEYNRNYNVLREFFADRILNLNRDNVKIILESIGVFGKLTLEERYNLSIKCRGRSIADCYWIKNENEDITFDEINIRKMDFKDIGFKISMLGEAVKVQDFNDLIADISTDGMYRKTWKQECDGLYLLKSDKTSVYINTHKEIEVSNILDEAGYLNHVKYFAETIDGMYCCKCKCFTSDFEAYVAAEYIKDYINRQGIDFVDFMLQNFKKEFADMIVIDYCVCNTDRHLKNFGFIVEVDSNALKSFAPLFDFNQALINFELHTEAAFDKLIYPPTNKTILETVKEWFKFSSVDLSKVSNKNVQKRFMSLKY